MAMTIGQLYDAIGYPFFDYPVYAQLGSNQKLIPLSGNFHVEDEVCYWFAASEDEEPAIGRDIIEGIEEEAEDDCWQGHGFRSKNTYEDCLVYFCNGDEETFDELKVLRYKSEYTRIECEVEGEHRAIIIKCVGEGV